MKKKRILYTCICVLLALNHSYAQAWSTIGNNGTNPNVNFLGTTDNKHFAIRTNNIERLRILRGGAVGIGTKIPQVKLDVKGNINIAADSAYRVGNTPVFCIPFGHNLIIGQNAGHHLQPSTHDNTTCGDQAMSLNESGNLNTAIGAYSMYNIDYLGSDQNTAAGVWSMGGTQAGSENCAYGANA